MSYLQLFFRTCILALLLAGADYACGFFYKGLEGHMNKEAANEHAWAGNELFQLREMNSDVIIMGSCEPKYVLDPRKIDEALKLDCYNCGSYGAAFLYQNSLLNGILNRYSPKIVIWGMNLSFLENDCAKDLPMLRVMYDEVGQSKQAIDFLGGTYEHLLLHSNLYRYNSLLHTYLLCVCTKEKNQNKGYIPNWKSPLYPPALKKREIKNEPLFAALLDATLQRCKKQGVDVHFFMIPTYYDDNFRSTSAYQQFRAIIEKYHYELVDEYFASEEFMKPENFIDANHLTAEANERLQEHYINDHVKHWHK